VHAATLVSVPTAPALRVASRPCGTLLVHCCVPLQANAFAASALLEAAVAALAAVCARAEGRLESLRGVQGETCTAERLLARYALVHAALSELLDPQAPQAQGGRAQRVGILARALGRGAPQAEPDAASLYPPPVTPPLLRGEGAPRKEERAPAAENPFDNAPPPPFTPFSPSFTSVPPLQQQQQQQQARPAPPLPPTKAQRPAVLLLPAPAREPALLWAPGPYTAPAPPPPPPPPPRAQAWVSAVRHGGALTLQLSGGAVGVVGEETLDAALCGERLLRACLRGVLCATRAPPPGCALRVEGPGLRLRVPSSGCPPELHAGGLVALSHSGPALAYQLSEEASRACLPLRVHAACASPDGRTVVLSLRITALPGCGALGEVLLEAPLPAMASLGGQPLCCSPPAEWDAQRRLIRWRLSGAPPQGRALLRARFAAAEPSPLSRRPVDVAVRLRCALAPFQVPAELVT